MCDDVVAFMKVVQTRLKRSFVRFTAACVATSFRLLGKRYRTSRGCKKQTGVALDLGRADEMRARARDFLS